ncbi:MAG: peptidase [Betaproteobacteria bacterium]|nr:peptidase [Betaproteobacteria bacterium]
MQGKPFRFAAQLVVIAGISVAAAVDAPAQSAGSATGDSVGVLVRRLDLEKYKSTLRGLARFGDRLHGTDRNRAAVNWIEAQLKSYGCAPVERMKFSFDQAPAQAIAAPTPASRIASGEIRMGVGGARMRGMTRSVVPNNDPNALPDAALRALDSQAPVAGPREQVYCTKVGATRPDEMFIVAAHMDGRGFGEAIDDDASGTALVMELARAFSSPDVTTERSIRFVLWNNEETGLHGARAYIEQRAALQGNEDPPKSGRYPEPRWLVMIQHDMMLWDHGMPRADGTVSPEQRPEADVNIEYQANSKFADQAMRLAVVMRDANERYATDYPAAVGHHMSNTDSTAFEDFAPSLSVRENERGMQIGAGWNPHYHQPTDRYSSYSDHDFRLGLNAAQTTLGAVGWMAGAALNK